MIVVTGGAGFIGSNLVRSLVADGTEVLVVDDAGRAGDRPALAGVDLAGHVGQEEFRVRLLEDPSALDGVAAVLHQGACSSTTETDEDFLTRNNLEYSITVLDACRAASVPLVYASSASVYGTTADAVERVGREAPLNGYARSKARFDQHVARLPAGGSQVVGLRYFNVYGPGEDHKAEMASLVLQLSDQIRTTGEARLFGAGEGAGPGEHQRDFVHVDDVVAVVRWFLAHPDRSGIYNCGTGISRSFNDLARAVIAGHGRGEIRYVPFPASLVGRYQSSTRADLTRLRAAGCDHGFLTLEAGVSRYLDDPRGPLRRGGTP